MGWVNPSRAPRLWQEKKYPRREKKMQIKYCWECPFRLIKTSGEYVWKAS